MASRLRLDLGPLDLVSVDGDAGEYRFGVIGEDVSFGSPQPVEVSVASLMTDGSPTSTQRWENREASFRVTIEAGDSIALAAGEAALTSQIGIRTTLSWTPPDGLGPTSVFDVETSSMEFLFSDLDETRTIMRRTFRLRLVCLPFVRSAKSVTFGASPVSDTVTVVDECESTSGWSVVGGYPGTFSVDSSAGNHASGTGSIKITSSVSAPAASSGGLGTTQVVKTLSIDASSGGYLTALIKPEWGQLYQVVAWITSTGGGRQQVSSTSLTVDQNGFFRATWPIPNASTITALEMKVVQKTDNWVDPTATAPNFWFDAIGRSAVSTTARQQVQSFDVKGSARSEGNLSISSTTGLGSVLLYTRPDQGDGFRPDLRRRLTSAGTATITDSTAINGSTVTLSAEGSGATPVYLDAPASSFRPGEYAMVARFKTDTSSTNVTLTVTAQVLIGSTLVGPQVRVATTTAMTLSTYAVVALGSLSLPPLAIDPASGAKIRFGVYSNDSATRFDELAAFPMDDAALTWVECGTGATSTTVMSRVWLDGPTSTRPRGALVVGNAANRSDARVIVPKSRGRHLLTPGRMLAYLMTTGSAATLSGDYFPRWHSNAGL